jgi:DNA-binding transcriptional LysR family regulator
MPFPIPLSALRAIEIVARRGALGPAAEELGVTPGAVSQHIRRAEKRLGITLFERTSAGLVPSAALSAQLPRLGEGFSMLASALSALRPDHGGVLTVTLGSVFASRFLVGRLARFSAEHPDLELRLIANGALLDLGRPDIDCGIRFGNGKWPGTTATLLGESWRCRYARQALPANSGAQRIWHMCRSFATKAPCSLGATGWCARSPNANNRVLPEPTQWDFKAFIHKGRRFCRRHYQRAKTPPPKGHNATSGALQIPELCRQRANMGAKAQDSVY